MAAVGFKQGGGTDGAQRSPLPYGGDIHSGNGCGEVFLELFGKVAGGYGDICYPAGRKGFHVIVDYGLAFYFQ